MTIDPWGQGPILSAMIFEAGKGHDSQLAALDEAFALSRHSDGELKLHRPYRYFDKWVDPAKAVEAA